MFSAQILLSLLLSSLAQLTWSRSLSLSLNFSMKLNNDAMTQQPSSSYNLSPEMIRACIMNTEYSMFGLNRLGLALSKKSTNLTTTNVPNDDNTIDTADIINGINGGNNDEDNDDDDNDGDNDDGNNNYINNADYDNMPSSPLTNNEKIEESIHCFAHCIYEQMGLVKNGIFVESEVFRRIYALTVERKIEECTNLDSMNKCEEAYKLHVCYSKLKSLEAERKLRKIIEYSENKDDDEQFTVDMSEESDNAAEASDVNDGGIAEIDADSSLNEIEGALME